MLKINQKVTVPPGGYRYTQPQTSTKITGPSWADLVEEVKKHRKANGIDFGPNLEAEIEDQLCQVLPAGECKQEAGEAYNSGLSHGINFEQVKRGTATLVDWFLSGRRRVNRDEASNRVRICSACHFNQLPSGCSSCNRSSLHEIVVKISGNESLPGDDKIEGCLVCGCALKAKVWLPLETIQSHVDDELNKKFPDWCWCKRK